MKNDPRRQISVARDPRINLQRMLYKVKSIICYRKVIKAVICEELGLFKVTAAS